MSYLFTEARPFGDNENVRKCKAVLLTNTAGSGTQYADLLLFNPAGATFAVRVALPFAEGTEIFPIRVSGVSFGTQGITGAVLA